LLHVLLCKLGEHLLGGFVAAVVDDENRQAVHREMRDGRADRVLVVVDRDHDAGSEIHHALSR